MITNDTLDGDHFHRSSVENLVNYSYGSAIFLLILNILIILMTVIGNILLILLLKVYHQLRVPSNILLASLAFADLSTGFVLQINNAINLLAGLTHSRFILIKNSRARLIYISVLDVIGLTALTSIIIHLCLITLDRFVAIKFSLRYVSLVTTSRVKSCIAGAWVLSVIIGITSSNFMPINGQSRVLFHAMLLLAALFMICIYLRIFCISRRHSRKIKTNQLPANLEMRTLEERRGLKTIALVTIFLLISFLPFTILTAEIRLVEPSDVTESRQVTREVFRQFANLLLFLNAAVNPLIYFFRSENTKYYTLKLYRSALQELTCYR